MSFVFVLDMQQRPLDPVHPGHARRLLAQGRAAVWRRYPFTLILNIARPDAAPTPLRLKIDPGSRITGLALVSESVPAAVQAHDAAGGGGPTAPGPAPAGGGGGGGGGGAVASGPRRSQTAGGPGSRAPP